MTYIFNILFCVCIMQVFLHVFRYQFCWNLLKHVKLIVKSERLFETIMYNRTFLIKKTFEEPITVNSKRTLSLRTMKRTLSLRALRSFRTLNNLCAAKNPVWLFGYSIWQSAWWGKIFSYKNFGLRRPRFHATVT